jgi:hypothetical protein
MSDRGELNNETAARVDLAVQLEQSQQSDIVVLCGWDYRPDCSIAIADAMHKYIVNYYPTFASKLICQRLSRDTVGDAVFSRIYIDEFFGNSSSRAVCVTTSDYHVNRTRAVFEFVFGHNCGIIVNGASGFGSSALASKESESLAAFRKTFSEVTPGDMNSIFASLRNSHPFYNGEVHPKIRHFHEVAQELKDGGDSL